MGKSGPLVLLAISIICFFAALAGLIAGGYGSAWWVVDSKLYKIDSGLWNSCRKDHSLWAVVSKKSCTQRTNLFEFTEYGKRKIIFI